LKATSADIAIGKYPVGQTPSFKRKTSALLKIVKMVQKSLNCYIIASHRL